MPLRKLIDDLCIDINNLKPVRVNRREALALKENLYATNRSLREADTGLYVASLGEHYVNFVWLRDNYYQVKPNLKNHPEKYVQTYQSILDYFINMEKNYDNKVTWLIEEPRPINASRFIHPRFHKDLSEITSDWGNVQIDALSYVLLGIAEGINAGLQMLRGEEDEETVQKIIDVLCAIEYWNVADNGIWEEYLEVHASSVGAAVGALKAIRECGFRVQLGDIVYGEMSLRELLPRESVTKDCDLALLTLIYPFNVVDYSMAKTILENVEHRLMRERGVIRYVGDRYYNLSNTDEGDLHGRLHHPRMPAIGNEAEWCFGFSFLALAYAQIGKKNIARQYLNHTIEYCVTPDFKVPELYYSKTAIPNDNNPLGWAVAMAILTIDELV